MTSDSSHRVPPRWAESVLTLLLPSGDRESIPGDLLEEYRESIVPALAGGADGWYVRQVAGYLARRVWPWSALVGIILVARYLFDSLSPVRYTAGVIHPRSAIMTYTLMGTFALCAGWHTWQSGHLRSGLLMATAAAGLGGALSAVGTLVCLAIWHDPGTLRAVQGSGGLGEVFWGVPLLVPIGMVTGAVGASAGRLAGALAAVASSRKSRGRDS